MLDKVIIVLVCFISMVITAENLKNFRGGHFRVYKGDQENEVCRFIFFSHSYSFIHLKKPSILKIVLSRTILYLENPSISNIPLSRKSFYLEQSSISNNPLSRNSSDISNILNILKVKTNIVNISDTWIPSFHRFLLVTVYSLSIRDKYHHNKQFLYFYNSNIWQLYQSEFQKNHFQHNKQFIWDKDLIIYLSMSLTITSLLMF